MLDIGKTRCDPLLSSESEVELWAPLVSIINITHVARARLNYGDYSCNLHYASIMLAARIPSLCLRLCQHKVHKSKDG